MAEMSRVARVDPRAWLSRAGLTAPAQDRPLVATLATIAMFGIVILLHYGDRLPILSVAAADTPLDVNHRRSLERILILLPVTYAALAFGARGGVLAIGTGLAILVPRALMPGGQSDYNLPEITGVVVVSGLVVTTISQQRREVEIEKTMRDNLRHVVGQVIRSQEEERLRIAMELHDETAQELLLTCQRLDRLLARCGEQMPEDVASDLVTLRSATVATLGDLRRFTQHLRPRIFDDHGLIAALRWLADGLHQEYGVQATVEVTGALTPQTRDAELLIFRIAQEAARNVGRHSGATAATISLACDRRQITLTVRDNGRGFNLDGSLGELAGRGKLGLVGMNERSRLLGGTLDIRSVVGRGTSVAVRIPISGSGQPRD